MAAIPGDQIDSDRERLTRDIQCISNILKGSGVSFADRLRLNEQRHELRRQLQDIPSSTFTTVSD